MLRRFVPIFYLSFATYIAHGQCGLQAGPMAGHSDMLEVTIWVQTKCAQKVQLQYWLEGHMDTSWTASVTTSAEHGYCAHLMADRVTPGNRYTYDVFIDDERISLPYTTTFVSQSLWQWRRDAPGFTFVAGSCNYVNEEQYDRPGRLYGGDYQIFSSIRAEDPDLMVWLGDNIYLREVDWNTRTGIYHRYTHTRALPELQSLLASTHHYATWDDHDYGPNDCDRSFWGKDISLEAFKDFWANPNYGAGDTEGITGTFFWNDCQFFIMDDRWYRAPRHGTGEYYGEEQLTWLIDALRYSKAPYKFICTGGQMLSDAAVFENYAQFPEERQALLDSIDKYNIQGVVFITGDRHHSEISRVVTGDGDVWYDITSSPMTSSATSHPDEPNNFRIPGSMIGVRNYAVFSVSGPASNRTCKVVFKDVNGRVLFEHVLQ